MAIIDVNGNSVSLGGGSGANYDGKTLVYLGDSICCFGSNTGGTGAIPDYLASMLGGTWKNYCVGGTTLASYRLSNQTYDMFTFGELADSIASGNFSAQETGEDNGVKSNGTMTVLQKVLDMKHLDWSKVDTIFVHFGTNDVAFGNQIGTASDAKQKNGTMCASLKYGVDKILSAYPLVKIVFCGMIWRNADGAPASSLIPKNAILKECCESIGIQFVDLLEEMGVNDTNRTTFLYDGTHPNGNGKLRYAETLVKHL